MANKNDFLNETLKNYVEGGDVLAIASEISKLKKNDPTIIDGTIGTLLDDNGNVLVLESVKKAISMLNDNQRFKYSPTQGSELYSTSLVKYLFSNYYDSLIANKHYSVIPTPGATGGIYLSLSLFNNVGDTVLIPLPSWGVYKNMAKTSSFKVKFYNFIKDGQFDIENFLLCLDEISLTQKVVSFILNDPCNNPLSYSLTDDEFDTLIRELNKRTNTKFIFIYDVAYYEFQKDDYHKRFYQLSKLDNHILPIIVFSASKAFTSYGLRLGSLVYIHKDENLVKDLKEISRQVARTRWSCVNSEILNAVCLLLSDKELFNLFKSDIENAKSLLFNRINIIISQAKEVGLKLNEYRGGFFLSFNCDNPTKVIEALKKEKIYVLPFNNTIRIAVCGLNTSECHNLALKISTVINKL